jgi:hypothetical protein
MIKIKILTERRVKYCNMAEKRILMVWDSINSFYSGMETTFF